MCNDNVMGKFYLCRKLVRCILIGAFYGVGPYPGNQYDIRSNPISPDIDLLDVYLNEAANQNALGVNLNYSYSNNEVFYAFQSSGDWVYSGPLAAIESLLNKGVRVTLYYG